MFVALGMPHARRMRHIVICGLVRSIKFFHFVSQTPQFSGGGGSYSTWNVCFEFLCNFRLKCFFHSKKKWARYYQKCTYVKKGKVFPLQARLWSRGWVDVQLYSSITAALEGGEWSAARLSSTLPRERPGTHCTGGRVGPRAGLDGRKISPHWDLIPGPSSP